jgi:molybdopterin/thiamine biosynthesis adenylyltransferase
VQGVESKEQGTYFRCIVPCSLPAGRISNVELRCRMGTQITAELEERARALPGPGGTDILTISPVGLAEVAAAAGISLRRAELAALDAHILPEHYLRGLGTLGWEGQRRLLEACVAVVGCGGLGGAVIEGLARSGVGRLIVVDGDTFVPHNLNRQLLGTMAALGRPKVEVAVERVAAVNPAVEVTPHAVWATADNLPGILAPADVVVDALDTPRDRLVLQAAAKQRGIPLVHGAIAGFIGQVTTIFPGDDTLTMLYGDEPPEHGAESVLGTPTPTPMLVAAVEVGEVLKLLAGIGEVLRGVLLYLDLESGAVERLPLLQT